MGVNTTVKIPCQAKACPTAYDNLVAKCNLHAELDVFARSGVAQR